MNLQPLGALAALALAATQVPAEAHAYLVDSIPAKKQEVLRPQALERIKLVFSGKADALYSTARLTDPSGATLSETTQREASHEMVLPAPARLAPGKYLVHYRVLSVDGDVVEGKVEFMVRAPVWTPPSA